MFIYPYKTARELLAVSEKYCLVGLKAQCGDSLIKQISLETVADLAILADLYSVKGCQMIILVQCYQAVGELNV